MADIRPFRGVHYNQTLFKDLSSVICPPYDIISRQQQQELHQLSEYNFIRLEYARELPQDTTTDNKFSRSAEILEQWLGEDILRAEREPAFYLHDHTFPYQGKKHRRRSIFACVRLEEWDKMVIRPHEGTLKAPRGERLSLLWALKANISPILALYEDREQKIGSALAEFNRGKPMLSAKNVSGESHEVRAITDTETIGLLSGALANEPLYIADGHHRYESSLAYRNECRNYCKTTSGEEPFNFVMMELIDIDDPGLIILPPHRLVRGIQKPVMDDIMARISSFFKTEEIPLDMAKVGKQVSETLSGGEDGRLILFGPSPDTLYVLKLIDSEAAGAMMPYFHSELYKKLDVSIVDHILLEKLLELSSEMEKESLAFSYDTADAVNKVLQKEYQLTFLLNPVKTGAIKAIADIGDKMPRKSTYFYPKSPAGLIFNRLV